MRTIERKINSNLFKTVVIETKADDVVIVEQDDDQCIIRTTINNNVDDDITEYLIDSGKYDVELAIKSEVLYIRFIKQSITLLEQPDYFEVIGLIILIPKGKTYKHVKK